MSERKKEAGKLERVIFIMGLPTNRILKTICVTQLCTLPWLIESIFYKHLPRGMVMIDPFLLTQTYLARLLVDNLIDRKYKGYCIQNSKKPRRIIYWELFMAFAVGCLVNNNTTSEIFNLKTLRWIKNKNDIFLLPFIEGFIFRAMAWYPYFYLNLKLKINSENYFQKLFIGMISYSFASALWTIPIMILMDRHQIKDISFKSVLNELTYLRQGIILNSVCIVALDYFNLI
jgi:hypothetical protein